MLCQSPAGTRLPSYRTRPLPSVLLRDHICIVPRRVRRRVPRIQTLVKVISSFELKDPGAVTGLCRVVLNSTVSGKRCLGGPNPGTVHQSHVLQIQETWPNPRSFAEDTPGSCGWASRGPQRCGLPFSNNNGEFTPRLLIYPTLY